MTPNELLLTLRNYKTLGRDRSQYLKMKCREICNKNTEEKIAHQFTHGETMADFIQLMTA